MAGRIFTLLLTVASSVVASSLAFAALPSAAQAEAAAGSCAENAIDLSTADVDEAVKLGGINVRSANKLIKLRNRGEIVNVVDLRILPLNDRRFQLLVTDPRSCFAGVAVSELLPSSACESSDVGINTGTAKSLAEKLGWKNARLLISARPIETQLDIAAIVERGPAILGRLARVGGTCIDEPATSQNYFGEGRVVIGIDDVRPGRFVATPDGPCAWARFGPASQPPPAAIARANDLTGKQVVVDIGVADESFISIGCGLWRRVSAYPVAVLDSIPGDGDWLVSDQIAPGNYRASDVADCTWVRKSSLGGTTADVIESGELSDQHVLISIAATDAAFTSAGCGSWVPVATECMSQLDAVFPAEPELAPHVYGISDSVLMSTQYEIGLAFTEFTVNWGGFGGLNTPNARAIVEIEIGEGKVTGSTVIVGLGHAYRGYMRPDYGDFIDAMVEVFPEHVDRVIWVTPSRFNTDMPFVVEQLEAAAERWPQMEIADFWIEADAQNHPEWYNDEIHLDVEGRLVMADYLHDKLLNPCG